MSNKLPEIVTVEASEYLDEDFKHPTSYYFNNALGQRVYVRTRNRGVAKQVCDDYSGEANKYRVISVNWNS